jgi:predicted nuclease with TOPRIM domain
MTPAGMALQESQEEIDLDEASLEDIVEALTVDIKPVPGGWGNNGYPNAMLDLAKEELLALAQDTEEKERLEAMNKAIKKLQESNNNLNNNLKVKDKKISKLSQHLVMFKEKLEEVSLLNAKLLYTNKALASNSLNERQKKQIAESLLNAKTAEETKALYETLQSAAGRDARKQPESLSEVVGRKVSSTMILSSRGKKAESSDDPTTDRWKTLAGINKTK